MSPASSSSRTMMKTMPRLPAGFRFHPTDEELMVHYLMKQASSAPCPVPIIAEVNIYRCNPWELPRKALFGDKEWYFFSPRDRKYPNGARPNRAAGEGYWKATGTDKAIVSSSSSAPAPAAKSQVLGVKKALVIYRGKPPRGVKTDWVMHEYRLTTVTVDKNMERRQGSSSSSSMRLDDWVLCRIYKKSNDFQFASDDPDQDGSTVLEEEGEEDMKGGGGAGALPSPTNSEEEEAAAAAHAISSDGQHGHQLFPPPTMSMSMSKSCSLTDLLSTIDYSTLSQLLLDAPPPPPLAAETETATEQHQSPIVYSTTLPPSQPLLNNNNVNSNTTTTINDMPRGDHDGDALLLCSSEYGAGYNNSLKRKRVMTTTTDGAFDDGTSNLKRKLQQQLPSDASARISSGFFYGGYCNQQLAEAASSSSFQYSGLQPAGHNDPFLKNQQLLLYKPPPDAVATSSHPHYHTDRLSFN